LVSEVSRSDLEALVVSAPEFSKLERRLGRYNAFKVLGISRTEIRHSNILAWLMSPRESHGLGTDFLQRFLQIVVHEMTDTVDGVPSSLEVDAWDIASVEIRREWMHIDLLLLVKLQTGEEWALLIENKIESLQSEGQLSAYKAALAARPELQNHKHVFIFLTLHREPPQDCGYVQANYDQVYQALTDCIDHHEDAMGAGPRTLLTDYASLLEELAVEDNELVRLAKTLYRNHRDVLDFIYQHRPDPYDRISTRLQAFLRDEATALSVVPKNSDRFYIRFIPRSWDIAANQQGVAWGSGSPIVLWELTLGDKGASIKAVEGMAPDAWRQKLYALSSAYPFNYHRNVMPQSWMTVYTKKLDHFHGMPQEDDKIDALAETIVARLRQFLGSPEYASVTDRITELLAELK